MDAKTDPLTIQQKQQHMLEVKRVRLLAAIALLAGLGFLIALPFALRAGAEFFLPVTGALVISIALVPLLEWLEKHRFPSWLASLSSVVLFIGFASFVVASIVLPAIDWFALIPERIDRVTTTLAPIIEFYTAIEQFIENTLGQVSGFDSAQAVRIETPNSILDLIATSAPFALIQIFFALLLIFFFLSGWTAMRERTITSRGSFEGALTTARVIGQVVEDTSTYIATITFVNLSLGAVTALVLWALGMDSPVMWGGIVAVLNFIPYLGPIAASILLGLGGLVTFVDPWAALLPPLIFIGLHTVEANLITPLLVGKRVHISPLFILLSLSFWAWVWGTTGALLAIPLLIIMKTIFSATGTPDIAGFLFEDGTLTHIGEDDEKDH
ncbi:AI-2E family transporter [Sphingomicrobium lutaoense]|uniref:Putative PurR-regulated permease PerM n=1 Tax=Sphingomicrobium lutaoense TaxID=515949 RepID=A0A839Z2P2_9SPHN|nr:AI-2E family transporter [Sphingomicrobium lutaoense]MBB3763902.1 putative PurR-regulated permease PerM [Sphingomicrobium lutaoense]